MTSHLMDKHDLKVALARIGLHESATKSLPELVADYQEIHGLKVDGIPGPVTEAHLEKPRFCGVPDRLRGGLKGAAAMCRWDDIDWDGAKYTGPRTSVTRKYFVAMAAPGLTLDDTKRCVQQAWDEISKHAPVFCVPVLTSAEANITIKFAPIDGAMGVLAQTQLPCGPDTPSSVMSFVADSAEGWTYGMLLPCLTHEFGHFWGLEHGPTGCLMAPYLDKNVTTFQAWDSQQIQARYGAGTAPAPAPPAVPAAVPGSITIGNETWTAQFTKSSS